jgi:hypothetical protein
VDFGGGVTYAQHVNASYVTAAGTQTLTNKTLTDPKINAIKDSAGANQLALFSPGSAVNYVRVNSAAAGSEPSLQALGTDTDVGLGLTPKGDGGLSSYVNTQTKLDFYVFSDQTNADFNVKPQAAGRLQVNGVNVPTVSSTDTLTNKTLTAPAISSPTGSEDQRRQGLVGCESVGVLRPRQRSELSANQLCGGHSGTCV